jgi:CubicO group peptidase (beta-lactamase class C family)
VMLNARARELFVIFVMLAAAASSPCAAQQFISLDDVLEPIRAQESVPALAAAVMRGDELIASGATGVMEEGKEGRVTVASRWHVGSCTKAMTATMIGQLVHNGDITWNTTVIDVLPELEGKIDPKCAAITVHQLLSHTAGLPDYRTPGPEERKLLASLTGEPMAQRRQFLEKLLASPPVTEPGSKFDYSNAGYAVVAALAEAKTGMTWERLMRTRVFAPLGMAAGGTGWPRDEHHPREPLGHWRRDSQAVPHDPFGDYQLGPVLGPAGDVHCTIPELARFAGAHLMGLQGRDAPWISADVVAMLHKPVRDDYACGWVKMDVAGRNVEWHNGSAGTFFTWMTIDTASNIVVVVATNCGDRENACLVATERLLEQFAPRRGPTPPTKPAPKFPDSPKQAQEPADVKAEPSVP